MILKGRGLYLTYITSIPWPFYICVLVMKNKNQCLAMAALRRMAIPQDNRHLLVEAGILATLARAGRSGEVEIQREVITRPS